MNDNNYFKSESLPYNSCINIDFVELSSTKIDLSFVFIIIECFQSNEESTRHLTIHNLMNRVLFLVS